ncbi:hypothetical protein PSK87_03180 [Escherichia coli]|nr:hypothetical protein [Escherichia coli]
MKNYTTIACIGWHLLLAVAVTYISYCFRLDITFKDIEPIISILQNTSAMIFTIMGIWIAYVYPNAVLKIVQPSKVTTIFSEDDLKRVKLLVGVVISSAFILLLLLTGVTLKTFLTKTDVFCTILASIYRYWLMVFTVFDLCAIVLYLCGNCIKCKFHYRLKKLKYKETIIGKT